MSKEIKLLNQIHSLKVAIGLTDFEWLGAATDDLRALQWRLEGELAAERNNVFVKIPMPERSA